MNLPHKANIVALFSISGSVGKSQIGLGFYRHLVNLNERPLLVDADLVAGTLSLAASLGRVFADVESDKWTLKTLTAAALLERDMDIASELTFLPAADWVLCAAAIEKGKKLQPAAAILRSDVQVIIEAATAQEKLTDALFTAQEQQARFNSDFSAQRRLWRNLCRVAIRHRRNIIVDLPAQGPSGVAVARNWALIREDVRHVERDMKEPNSIGLKRVLVYTADEHPLVKLYQDASDQDLFFMRNMADAAVNAVGPRYVIPLANVGADLLGPSPLHELIKTSGRDRTLEGFQTFISAVAANIFR